MDVSIISGVPVKRGKKETNEQTGLVCGRGKRWLGKIPQLFVDRCHAVTRTNIATDGARFRSVITASTQERSAGIESLFNQIPQTRLAVPHSNYHVHSPPAMNPWMNKSASLRIKGTRFTPGGGGRMLNGVALNCSGAKAKRSM